MSDVGYAPWLSDPDEPDDMTDAEIAAAGTKAAEFMRNRGLLDFDPDQPRDPQGRWTEVGGGTGYEFYSPAVGQARQLPEAIAGLNSNRQRILREASQAIDVGLDLPSRDTSAVGAWSDGAENSIVSAIVANPPWAKLVVSGAMKGHIADQKAVLVFKQQDGGASALYQMQVPESDPQKLHENLLADGVAFHTIVPHPVGSEVYVADLDGSAHDAMAKAAERYDAQVTYQRGRAEFIGTHKEDGTDREQRDDARRAYEEIIKQSSIPRSAEIWSRVHHHWGETLGAVTDFNPYHEPAGSPEGGRFASGEGASTEASRQIAAAGGRLELAARTLRNAGFEASPETGVRMHGDPGPVLNAGAYPEHAPAIREYWAASVALSRLTTPAQTSKVRQPDLPPPSNEEIRQLMARQREGSTPTSEQEVEERARSFVENVAREPWGSLTLERRAGYIEAAREQSASERLAAHQEAPQPSPPTPVAGETKKKVSDLSEFSKSHIDLDRDTQTHSEKRDKFIDLWNSRINEAPEEFRQEFLGGLAGTMTINYKSYNDSLVIGGDIEDKNGDRVARYDRTIDLRHNSASSDYFKVFRQDDQGSGIGKQLLAGNVETYKRLGIDKVEVGANIDVGGYAWARYGYVPTQRDWQNLKGEIGRKLDREAGRDGGGRTTHTGDYPGSWDEMSEDQHSSIEQAWMRATHREFLESEVDNWRESGDALNSAKTDLAHDYTASSEWAKDALEKWHDNYAENAHPKVPFSDEQILSAITVDYSDRHGDGRSDPDINIDDKYLDRIPLSDPAQLTFPGIESVKSSSLLTQDVRDEIEKHMVEQFNSQATRDSDRMDPPSYIEDNIREYQGDYWDGMRERDRFDWARAHNELPEIEVEEDEDVEPIKIEAPQTQINALMRLARSNDPKAIWPIADSAYGKQLLLNTNWHGALDLHDKETMDRFNAYVGKRKKETIPPAHRTSGIVQW